MDARAIKATFLWLLLAAGALSAQAPQLRVSDDHTTLIFTGVQTAGAPLYPVKMATALGIAAVTNDAGGTMHVFGDTVTFWSGSPFFRAGTRVQQLAHSAVVINGELHVPEQFFIQWLPRRHADRIEYTGGELRQRRATAASAADAPPPAAVPAVRPVPVRATPAAGPPARTRRIVVLDPGHGGKDPGSRGAGGLLEKDVALSIARRLNALLATRGYQVHQTRTTDTLIALRDRPRMANRWKGDEPGALYISIHMNALASPSARGFETFFLSEAGTDDERRVAEMENAAVQYESRPAAGVNELDQVLNGLRNDFYLRASNDFAAVVQQRLAAIHPGPNRGVKRAPFAVLVGALMPAVLVEVAFITNPVEGQLLGSAGFQDKVAFGLADAVDRFFAENEHLWERTP